MSILNLEKTKEQKILEGIQKVLEANRSILSFLVASYPQAFDLVWGSSDYTAKEIVDKMNEIGIDTVKLFTSSKLIQDFICHAVLGEDVVYDRKIPTLPFTIEDGKIVISEDVTPE